MNTTGIIIALGFILVGCISSIVSLIVSNRRLHRTNTKLVRVMDVVVCNSVGATPDRGLCADGSLTPSEVDERVRGAEVTLRL